MRKWIASLMLLCAGCGSGSSGGSPQPTPLDFSSVGARLDALVADGTIPGYSFMLFTDEGALYSRAGGLGPAGTIAALDTLFPIASASKLPAAAAILTLVDDGDLDLDRPVADYIGSDISWPAAKQAITMRMLLAHTSGLDPQPSCLDDQGITLKQCAQAIANLPLVASPGSAFIYGGGSYQIAAYVATLISGQAWRPFFSSRIAVPLGLFRFDYEGLANPRVAGGGITNVVELSDIQRMVLGRGRFEGRRVLSEAMADVLLSQQVDTATGGSSTVSPLSVALYPGYTLGYFISNPALHPRSPGPEFSDPGAFGAVPWIDVGSHYGAVLLIKQDAAMGAATGISIWNSLRPLILSQLNPPA